MHTLIALLAEIHENTITQRNTPNLFIYLRQFHTKASYLAEVAKCSKTWWNTLSLSHPLWNYLANIRSVQIDSPKINVSARHNAGSSIRDGIIS